MKPDWHGLQKLITWCQEKSVPILVFNLSCIWHGSKHLDSLMFSKNTGEAFISKYLWLAVQQTKHGSLFMPHAFIIVHNYSVMWANTKSRAPYMHFFSHNNNGLASWGKELWEFPLRTGIGGNLISHFSFEKRNPIENPLFSASHNYLLSPRRMKTYGTFRSFCLMNPFVRLHQGSIMPP